MGPTPSSASRSAVAVESSLREAARRLERPARRIDAPAPLPTRQAGRPGPAIDGWGPLVSPPVGGVASRPRALTGPPLLALQRSAGNAAVTALLTGLRSTTEAGARSHIDDALVEVRRSEPDIDKVEKGLKAARDAGVPVDLEGEAHKPPASALEVENIGFDAGAVAPKQPVPPPTPTPPHSPLAAAAKAPKRPRRAGGSAAGRPPGGAGAGGGGAPQAVSPTSPASELVAAGDGPSPPVRPGPVEPLQDPAFTAVTGAVGSAAKAKRAHPPAATKAAEAQKAAVPPTDDVDGQAKAAKVDTMAAQQAGAFDKKAFIAAVKAAIEAKTPKTLKEADDYAKSGKAGEVKDDVKGLVDKDTDASRHDIESATDAPADASKAVPKPVEAMSAEEPGAVPSVEARGAAPKPAPAEQTDLGYGRHEVGQEMADGEVSEDQLARSNEPEFTAALDAKREAASHAEHAPQEYRQHEQEAIGQSQQDAAGTADGAMATMHGARERSAAQVTTAKEATKARDEDKRAQVTAKVQAIYTATEADVRQILDGLDAKVDAAFTAGEAAARAKFERLVETKMSAYKRDRYGGWLGGLRWAKDKLLGMPSKVNEFFEAGRQLYLREMERVISSVADVVGAELGAAKARIAQGRQEIADYVASLPTDLQAVGQEAAQEVGERFSELESDVESAQQGLVDSLAAKYVEARQGLDERIVQMQEENKGLVAKAVGAVKAVVATIKKLKDMLLGVLATAAGVIGKIIKSPIAFLKNLVSGVKGGILRFKERITTHLQTGLMGWLLGALGEAGIQLPEQFDLRGIINLITSVLGLTWNFIRSRVVKAVGEKAAKVLETTVDIFVRLATDGPAAIWQDIVAKVGDVKEMILSKVRDFVITKIIIAGVTWLISLLNPAAAFIKACKLIYDIVMFFVNNAARLVDLIKTIVDSVSAIAAGQVGAVVSRIEGVLAKMLPVVIGFLASVLGLGGIGKTIRSIIEAVSRPVKKVIDAVIKKGVALARKLIKKGKAKATAVKDWLKKLRRPFDFGDGQHTLSATPGDRPELMISSQPKKAVAVMTDEVARATKANDSVRVGEARLLLAACTELEQKLRAAARSKDEALVAMVQAKFGFVLGALRDYGKKYRRRGLVPKAELEEGSVRPYNLQPKGGKGKLEHEHVIPGALFAAWMGLERASAAIKAMYKNMMTVTWKYEAARAKTASDAGKWTAMKAKRDAFLARPEVVRELRKAGGWKRGQPLPNPPDVFGSLDDLKSDRVRASVAAAKQTNSKVTSAQIEAAASAQLAHLKVLFGELRRRG
jgi:hypothetical protein